MEGDGVWNVFRQECEYTGKVDERNGRGPTSSPRFCYPYILLKSSKSVMSFRLKILSR